MHTDRFKSLSTPITADNKNMSHEIPPPLRPEPLIPNSRWHHAKEDMHTNPFRQSRENRLSRSSPPTTNSRWQKDDSDAKGSDPFRQSRGSRFSRSSPPPTNSRWQKDDSDAKGSDPFRQPRENQFSRGNNNRRWQKKDSEDKGRSGDMFNRRDRRESNGRYQPRREYNSFNRRTKRAPKPVFKMEGCDFPPLGKAGAPAPSSPNMNFSKAAHKNKDRPGPKHIIQFPERMPRTKKESLAAPDPLDWNTDDEDAAHEAAACSEQDAEPDWPAKGGYVD